MFQQSSQEQDDSVKSHQQWSKANFSCQVMSSYGQCSVEKLAGDLLLGLKFVKLEILSTSFIDFLYEMLGELRPEWVNIYTPTTKFFSSA